GEPERRAHPRTRGRTAAWNHRHTRTVIRRLAFALWPEFRLLPGDRMNGERSRPLSACARMRAGSYTNLRAVADEDGSDRATLNTASLSGRVWARRGATLHILHPVSDRSSDRGDPAAPMPSGD